MRINCVLWRRNSGSSPVPEKSRRVLRQKSATLVQNSACAEVLRCFVRPARCLHWYRGAGSASGNSGPACCIARPTSYSAATRRWIRSQPALATGQADAAPNAMSGFDSCGKKCSTGAVGGMVGHSGMTVSIQSRDGLVKLAIVPNSILANGSGRKKTAIFHQRLFPKTRQLSEIPCRAPPSVKSAPWDPGCSLGMILTPL